MKKIIKFKPKGMNRDLSKANFSPEFSYENKNIRFTTNEANSLMSITNERGPALETRITTALNNRTILGHSTLEKNIIIFCKSDQEEKPDHIIVVNDEEIKDFAGNLEFDIEHPIEAISIYENENVQKVYWTDGKNPPRVLNICNKDTNIVNNHIDFVPDIQSFCDVEITKDDTVSGHFPSGTMQYAFTYINVNGSESNIFYTSPLFYIVYNDRGASPEESISTGFKIQMQDLDPLYKYVRIYSITRTSKDAIPVCKRVIDLYINKDSLNNNTYYIDNGLSGDTIDPTELLYVGGEKLIAQTISHKDNTLFLGNINYNSNYLDLSFEKKDGSRPNVSFKADKILYSTEYTGYYSYKNTLNKSNWEITTFKYNEWYRFGIQAQDSTGKWSEPIWINDCQNTTSVADGGPQIFLVTASYTIPQNIVNELLEKGYTKVRPVIVYPSIHDRECLCQGVVCPTVYNVKDRVSNSPYTQASWVFRPDFTKAPFEDYNKDNGEVAYYPTSTRKNSFEHDYTISQSSKSFEGDLFQYTEIQCLDESPYFPLLRDQEEITNTVLEDWASHNSEYFFVDRSIVTLNSPDIEFDDSLSNLDLSNTKFRIVGVIPIHSNYTSVDIKTSTPPIYRNGQGSGLGALSIQDQFPYGEKGAGVGMVTDFLWKDFIAGKDDDNKQREFPVYLWHREGSLNNTSETTLSDDVTTPAELKNKRISILRTSVCTEYLNDETDDNKGIWEPTYSSKIALFNLSEIGITTIDSQKQSVNPDIVYYGNIDKVVSITAEDYIIKGEYTRNGNLHTRTEDYRNKAKGYKLWERTNKNSTIAEIKIDDNIVTSKAPVNLKYKSSPHIVVAFNYNPDGPDTEVTVECLPYNKDKAVRYPQEYLPKNVWNKKINKINISNRADVEYDGFLWLGEIYRDNVVNRFGGTTKEALEQNSWLPCGDSISLVEGPEVLVKWKGGDTYYQRYDCLKTYPFSFEDKNQLTDILSFMCETRVNIDGRYDKNRGMLSNFTVSPNNFNLINPVYSQQDNFFNYRIITDKDNIITKFATTITWSKTKKAGEKTDTWTNITLASTLDLDGDKGPITSLQKYNNQIIAFQTKGVSQILYNENMQISTESGVPIEIANSGKVNGKRYITNNIGCQNKWSICSTPSGIYFIDDYNKSINLFAGEVIDLSKKHGFNSWINSQSSLNKWNPKEFDNFVTFYDNKNKDVLFINNYTCLAYSEVLGQFTSFYDYNKVFPIINILGNTYLGRENKVYLHNEGDYNKFFDAYKPFYIEVIANENPTVDKIFTNIEFTSDTWNNDGLANNTFDILTVHNEYQQGSKKLSFIKNKPSSLKRKFRLWRADIPRDSSNNRDRMRNTWLNLKLEKSNTDKNTDKTVLHDLSVYYHI